MKAPLHTLLLITLTFALVLAPLRGALAITALSTADSNNHCAEMMPSMPATDSAATQHHAVTQDSNTEDCCQQCDGSCADSNCVNCVQSTIAIANIVSLYPDSHSRAQISPLLVSFPQGNFSPPYRPPVSI
jgi:hypothetical protein